MSDDDVGQAKEIVEVPVAWEALEDAFENNAPEVHSYLHFDTGEVIRIVDGVADPTMHSRIMNDKRYLRIDPVSSREQYRWMERFIATVEDDDLRRRLNVAIDGKGAFRRFKDALMSHPVDRERWFAFRSERLRACMESWLMAHGIRPVERPTWQVPTANEVIVSEAEPGLPEIAPGHPGPSDGHRRRLHELVDGLGSRDLETARRFLEFLKEKQDALRATTRASSEPSGSTAQSAERD